MRPRILRSGVLAAALVFAAACASRRDGPFPTLEDYSDGTSRWAEELLEGEMPMAIYLPLHPEALLSTSEKKTLADAFTTMFGGGGGGGDDD